MRSFLLDILIRTAVATLTFGLPLEDYPAQNSIIFPENDDTILIFVPKCSNNRTFCEDVAVYPQNKFYKILKNTTYEKEYFNSLAVELDASISDRFHPEKEHYLCNVRTRKLYPRVARNTKKEWKFVYNFGKYKQEVTTEECITKGSCTALQGSPKEVKTRCLQKYSDRLLLVADKNGHPIWDLFWFPSACVCSYKPTISFNTVL